MNSIGRRTHATRTGAATNGTGWGYDTLGQLVSADDTNPAADRAYQYDTIGNRKKTATAGLTLPEEDNWSANALNQLTKANGEDLPVDSYDDDGNQLKAKILPLGSSSLASCVYHWDAENRLTSVTSPTGEVLATYTYDAQSRLISRSVGVPPTTTTYYVYDGWNRIAEYQLQNSSFNLHTSYLWGLDLSGGFQGAGGVGGLLSVNRIGSPLAYPAYDGNGNITEYIGADGTVLAHFEYDPFGNTDTDTDTTNQFAYRFSTKPIAPATGLYYYGYRWYDPLTGRWPSRDPMHEFGGLNLYSFLDNAAVDQVDILGLRTVRIDGVEVDYDSLPPDAQKLVDEIDEAERVKQALEEKIRKLEEFQQGRRDGTVPPPVEIGDVEVTRVPVFESEYKKCLYECMEDRGAIAVGFIGMQLSGFGMAFGVIPKPAGTTKLKNGKDITNALSKLQTAVNEIRKKKGMKPIQNIRQLGDKLSKYGDSIRWISIAMMSYANGMFAECVCECKDKDKTPKETR